MITVYEKATGQAWECTPIKMNRAKLNEYYDWQREKQIEYDKLVEQVKDDEKNIVDLDRFSLNLKYDTVDWLTESVTNHDDVDEIPPQGINILHERLRAYFFTTGPSVTETPPKITEPTAE